MEVIGDKTCSLPQLPYGITQPQVILTSDNEILVCGGSGQNMQKCLTLKNGAWVTHSTLIHGRGNATAVTTSDGIYLLGGSSSPTTSEFLPTGSTDWQYGPRIPEPGFEEGCTVRKSDFEIVLIGGRKSGKRIIQLNTKTNDWTLVGHLQEGRYAHACAMIDSKIVVSDGRKTPIVHVDLTSTDVISTEVISTGKLNLNSENAGNLNERRAHHGSAVAHVNGEPTLLAFGGFYHSNYQRKFRDSIESWNPETESWTISNDLKLSMGKESFGFLSVPANVICRS